MDFKKAAILGSYISKDYAEDLFRLLVTYKDIPASEAASRLNMHIKTVQDTLADKDVFLWLYRCANDDTIFRQDGQRHCPHHRGDSRDGDNKSRP